MLSSHFIYVDSVRRRRSPNGFLDAEWPQARGVSVSTRCEAPCREWPRSRNHLQQTQGRSTHHKIMASDAIYWWHNFENCFCGNDWSCPCHRGLGTIDADTTSYHWIRSHVSSRTLFQWSSSSVTDVIGPSLLWFFSLHHIPSVLSWRLWVLRLWFEMPLMNLLVVVERNAIIFVLVCCCIRRCSHNMFFLSAQKLLELASLKLASM